MDRVKNELQDEIAVYIREEEENAKFTVQAKSKELLALAMQNMQAKRQANEQYPSLIFQTMK